MFHVSLKTLSPRRSLCTHHLYHLPGLSGFRRTRSGHRPRTTGMTRMLNLSRVPDERPHHCVLSYRQVNDAGGGGEDPVVGAAGAVAGAAVEEEAGETEV